MDKIKKIERLSTSQWATEDPFLFCAFHNDLFPQGNINLGPDTSLENRNIGQDFIQKDGWAMYHGSKVPGFPAHPHAGFETITIAEKGYVDHSDSLGAYGRFGKGDVQWMTAGKGVQHSEMFPLLNKHKQNPLLLFQIWLNLAAANKNVEPYFDMHWCQQIPTVQLIKDNITIGHVKIIAGTYEGVKALQPAPDSWAANPENDVNIWLLNIEPNVKITIPAGKFDHSNRSLYFYDGDEIVCEDYHIPPMHRVLVDSNQSLHLKNGSMPASLLILQGKPINEPVIQHGPFVASSREGLNEIFKSLQRDDFGGWPWDSKEQVHGEELKRFAKYPDGKFVVYSLD